MIHHEGDCDEDILPTNLRQRYHEEEFATIKQANEDLKKTLQINKKLIGELLSSNSNSDDI